MSNKTECNENGSLYRSETYIPTTFLDMPMFYQEDLTRAIALIGINRDDSAKPELIDATSAFCKLNPAISSELEKLLLQPAIEHEGIEYSRLEAMISKGTNYNPNLFIFMADNICYQCNITPAKDLSGKNVLQTEIQKAILEQVTAALIQDREERIKIEKRVQRLFSLLSHDLRNPLAVIYGNAQLAQRAIKNPNEQIMDKLERCTNNIVTAARNLNEQITDLVLIFRASEYPKPIIINPANLFASVAEENAELIETKKVELIIDAPFELPQVRLEKKLFVLIQNTLLLNAIQAMEEIEDKKIILKAVEKDGYLVFSISDSGPGMDESKLKNCFTEQRSSTNGSGKMLAISKEIVEEDLGGKIEVESTLDVGTTFRIYIPIYKPTAQSTQKLNN